MAKIKGKWRFVENVSAFVFDIIEISFVSNGQIFKGFYGDSGIDDFYFVYGNYENKEYIHVAETDVIGSSWREDTEKYRTVDFGETEQTVSDEFYTWFTANATQLKVTDLKGTTWNVNAGWEAEAGYGVFGVVGVAGSGGTNDFDFDELFIGYECIDINTRPTSKINNIAGRVAGTNQYDGYSNPATMQLRFTYGEDVTNVYLIAWLSKYGELVSGGEDEDELYLIDESTLTDIADAIRTKRGITGNLNPANFASEILSIGQTPTTQTLTVINSNNPSETATFITPSGSVFDNIIGDELTFSYASVIGGSSIHIAYCPTKDGTTFYLLKDGSGNPIFTLTDANGTFYYEGESATQTLTVINKNNPSETAQFSFAQSSVGSGVLWSSMVDKYEDFTYYSDQSILYKGYSLYENEDFTSHVYFDTYVSAKSYYYAGEAVYDHIISAGAYIGKDNPTITVFHIDLDFTVPNANVVGRYLYYAFGEGLNYVGGYTTGAHTTKMAWLGDWKETCKNIVVSSDTAVTEAQYNSFFGFFMKGPQSPTPVDGIVFTIESTTYQAESGMTWRAWIASSYNTLGLTIKTANNVDYVWLEGTGALLNVSSSTYDTVLADDTIIGGNAYDFTIM